MPNTVTETPSAGAITLTYAGNGADWDSRTNFPGGLKVKSIKFWPSAATDILTVRNGSATGPIIGHVEDLSGTGVEDIGFGGAGEWCFPYIKISDQTFGTPANASVILIIT